MNRLFGPLSAAAVVLLGVLAGSRAGSPAEAADALRALGTLLTVVTGLFSAVWWHQSASLSARPRDSDAARPGTQEDADVLNGAAATATGLALLGGVYASLSWASPEAGLAGLAFVLLLAMSGGEIWLAAGLSLRQGLRPRSALALVILVLASLLFAVRRLLH